MDSVLDALYNTNISVIDAVTNTVSSTVDVQGFNPDGIAVNKDDTTLYVATGGGYGVSVIDTATNSYTCELPYAGKNDMFRSGNVAVNPVGTKVYMTWTDGTVTVTDIDTNTVQATVYVGQEPS